MADGETLADLMRRRMAELAPPGGAALSMHQIWLRGGGSDRWAYESVRRIHGGRTAIGDRVADALAAALDVDVAEVLAAAGQRPRLEPFTLPRRADRLTRAERYAVVGVVDAILGGTGRTG